MLKKLLQLAVLAMISCGLSAWAGNFIDNLNGTVTDEDTSLIWQQEDDRVVRNWEEAISYCEGLDFAGDQDWRLPNIKELKSITDNTVYSPAFDQEFFTHTASWDCWSSTTKADVPSAAWRVNFVYGIVSSSNKSLSSYFARCVRGGQ